MDTLAFIIAVLLIMLAIQFNQQWMILGVVGILIVSMRSVGTILLVIITLGAFFLFPDVKTYGPIILVSLIIIALAFGSGDKPGAPQGYPMDMFGDMGGGGYGGPGGY